MADPQDGEYRHGGPGRRRWAAMPAAEMEAAARTAGNSEMLDRFAADYPQGPARQAAIACARPSARCASGLRMKRVATVLSGSACCVYGLTFVSHFYGARRSVGYVPFNSETLVTGKLFEDIREAVHDMADPDALRRHRGDQPLRADGVGRAAAAACRTRSTACASSASTCPASAFRPMPRPRTCWPARCWTMPARRPRPGRWRGPRRASRTARP